MNSLPRPDFDTDPYNVITITDEVRDKLLACAEDLLLTFQTDGPQTAATVGVALASMVKDALGAR